MILLTTKRHENIYLEKALELLELDLQVTPRESPDFELSNGHEIWGIEVRNLLPDEHPIRGGSQAKAKESRNAKQMQILAHRYYENEGSPISLKILGTKTIEPYSDLIFMAISKRTISSPRTNQRICLPHGVTLFITDRPHEFPKYSKWEVVDDKVGWVRHLTNVHLQAAIDNKSEKLASYLSQYPKIDLLLICDRLNNSGKWLLPSAPEVSNPGFSNIYLLLFPLSITRLA